MSSVSTGACISSDAIFSALSRTFSAATRVADAVITVAREACAPMPCSMRSVWPWMTRIFFMSAPSISAATCAITVSKPCPIEAPPVMTSISPEVSTWMRTPSAGPRPAFSTNMARPTPTISPLSRRAASSRLSFGQSTWLSVMSSSA